MRPHELRWAADDQERPWLVVEGFLASRRAVVILAHELRADLFHRAVERALDLSDRSDQFSGGHLAPCAVGLRREQRGGVRLALHETMARDKAPRLHEDVHPLSLGGHRKALDHVFELLVVEGRQEQVAQSVSEKSRVLLEEFLPKRFVPALLRFLGLRDEAGSLSSRV